MEDMHHIFNLIKIELIQLITKMRKIHFVEKVKVKL